VQRIEKLDQLGSIPRSAALVRPERAVFHVLVDRPDMKFINSTGNSVYLEDIDRNVLFEEGKIESIDVDDILKSNSFQQLVLLGAFDIVEHGSSRIEKNLARLRAERDSEGKNDETEDEEPRMPSGIEPEVIIKGHFYEAGGYAKVNRNLAFGLAKSGINVEIDATNKLKSDLNEIEARALNSLTRKVGNKAIRIDSIIPSFSRISPKMPYRILYTTIEATTVPEQTVNVCNAYDELWVTSDFCKTVLEEAGVKRPILVMPASVQTNLYHENHEAHEFRPKLKDFVFVSLFGWGYRKGYDALLRAYLEEFDGDDDVSLLIVSRYQQSSKRSDVIRQEIEKFIKKYGKGNPAHIARCSRVIPEHELPRIYKACDAFVLPSRGEGFGLPYCEASLCGLPVIATNHSGQTMFLNKDNSSLVDIDTLAKVTPGSSHVHYWDNQMMPSLKSNAFIQDLGSAMRDVYENYDEACKKNKLLQSDLRESYSFSVNAERASKRLKEIWQEVRPS